MKWIKAAMLISLLFVEFQTRICGINVNAPELLAGLLFVYIIFQMITKKISFSELFTIKKLNISYIIYFIVLSLIVIYHNYGYNISMFKYIMVLVVGFVIFLDFYYQKNDETNWQKYFNILLILACVVSLYGIYEVTLLETFPKRFDSFFWGRSNRMATRLLMIMPIAFYLAKYKNKIYYIIFYIICLGLFMTVSRGGLLVFSIFVILNIKEFIRKKNILRTFCGFSFIAIIMYVLGLLQSLFFRTAVLSNQMSYQVTHKAVNTSLNAGDAVSSSISRVILWKRAFKVFLENPFAGLGVDTYKYFYMYDGKKVAEVNAHNWVLHLLAEVGFIGLFVTIILIVCIFFILFKKYRKSQICDDTDLRIVSLSGLWAISLFLIHNMIEASCTSLLFGYDIVSIFLIIILGIALGYKGKAKY